MLYKVLYLDGQTSSNYYDLLGKCIEDDQVLKTWQSFRNMTVFLQHDSLFETWQSFCNMTVFLQHDSLFPTWQSFCNMTVFSQHDSLFTTRQSFHNITFFLQHDSLFTTVFSQHDSLFAPSYHSAKLSPILGWICLKRTFLKVTFLLCVKYLVNCIYQPSKNTILWLIELLVYQQCMIKKNDLLFSLNGVNGWLHAFWSLHWTIWHHNLVEV